MKKLSFYSFLALLAGALLITSCENSFFGPDLDDENSILPEELTVELPAALWEDVSALKGCQ